MVSYHFYAVPGPTETIENWQYSFFSQADEFVAKVHFVGNLRQRLSPGTRTAINEVGSILPNDAINPVPLAIPKDYWGLSAAMYASLYVSFSKLGIDLLGESQLVGSPAQFPEVTLIDWSSGAPNARYWVLKLLIQSIHQNDEIVSAHVEAVGQRSSEMSLNLVSSDIVAQGYKSLNGAKRILLVNRRIYPVEVGLERSDMSTVAAVGTGQ